MCSPLDVRPRLRGVSTAPTWLTSVGYDCPARDPAHAPGGRGPRPDPAPRQARTFDHERPRRGREAQVQTSPAGASRPGRAQDRRATRRGTCPRHRSGRLRVGRASTGSGETQWARGARGGSADRLRPPRATSGIGARVEEARRARRSVSRPVTSWWLTPTRSARRMIAEGSGWPLGAPAPPAVELGAGSPATRRRGGRRSGIAAAQASVDLPRHRAPATSPARRATTRGSAGTGQRHRRSATDVCTRPSGVSTIVKDRALRRAAPAAGRPRRRAACRARSPWPPSHRRPTIAAVRSPSLRRRQRRIRDAATEPPAARVLGRRRRDTPNRRGRPRRAGGPWHLRSVYCRLAPTDTRESTCSSTSCMRATTRSSRMSSSSANPSGSRRSSSSWSRRIRRRIQDGYIHDTLSEAIAVELERDYEFIFVSDDRLTAAVNVSSVRRPTTSWPTSGTRGKKRGGRRENDEEQGRTGGRGLPERSWRNSTPTAGARTDQRLKRISSTSPSLTR